MLFLVPSLRRAGAETQLIDLVNALDSALVEKTLGTFEANLDQLERVNRNEIAFCHHLRRHKYDFSVIQEIARLIEQREIDVVHCTLQISLLVGWVAVRLARRKPRLVVALHTTVNVNRKFELFDRVLYRWLIDDCDRIIFVCRAQAAYWKARYPSLTARSVVIYNGVSVKRYQRANFDGAGVDLRRRLSIPPVAGVLTCIAGLRQEKGHRYLIEAFAALQGEPYLLLAGDGPLRAEIEALAAQLGVAERVRFLGEVRDVRPVLAASDLSVLASTAVETFSIAMLESMAMEVPVVATDVGGLAEAISVRETGALVKPADAGDLGQAIASLLNNPQLRSEMGGRARRRVQEQFSTTAMTRATETMLRELCAPQFEQRQAKALPNDDVS